ncbi:uncharacterized protein LACBIDRAFT_295783 [Laccaria bicolor S238N-H82]|uniref:Predicted protein n=1 Tax=Laccaria bicolor (strain S238N-H82 / ATCC MYA-4686) TaxID=486041 RepID=B0DYA9_LACBS|nr:uncharacterized protein LACBIDRAFT_295783 [Laccaria bicolor S238N-H82]EDR00405.1 predicted protein [Laccaria bicolor S238N-H82]|eukprot:XP_001888964.1 predicted protein [Laccaria bicolor S238N-H82]
MNSKRYTARSTSTVDETRAASRVESIGASILSGASSTSVLGGEIINSQRDHNRATFIINLLIIGKPLDIGAPDSDTSRSTLAVSKPSTLGTVTDLPHASTSSKLARDLPCPSTSSASDQEQSLLEEFNASTDSGYGSEVSSEIKRGERADLEQSPDSPPNEDENLFEEEPNAIYERHMYLKKHGFPLWIPQPNMRLPHSYRRQGVSIGDVGIFAWDGSFDFLFNVCLPAGHPNNPDELPEGFSCLTLRPTDVSEVRAHSAHSHMTSASVQKQDGATFECSGSDGAVLTMPQGAYHEDLKNISRFRDYALTHAESWYQYANGPCGREIGNGQLHMVTGCDKTTAWGIATYSHLQSKRPEGSVTLLNFEAVGNEHHGRQPYAWDYKGTVEAKVGPEEDELVDLGVQGSAPLRNQCTFVRSLTPTLGHDDWERLQSKIVASAKDQASEQSPKNPITSVLGAISSLPVISSARPLKLLMWLRSRKYFEADRFSDSCTGQHFHLFHAPLRILTILMKPLSAHPATYVTDMILQKCPKAKVVVVHDSDWCSVIRDSCKTFRIDFKRHLISLKRRMGDHGDSSDEDQQPGPSHIFDHFAPPSPLKMKGDYSSFFKDGEDENIKFDEHYDSGEANDEDNPMLDAAFLDSILPQSQKANHNASFAQPSPLKTSIDAYDDDPSPDSSKHGLTNSPDDVGIPFPAMDPHSSQDNFNKARGMSMSIPISGQQSFSLAPQATNPSSSRRVSSFPDLQHAPDLDVDLDRLAKEDPLTTQIWRRYAKTKATSPHAQRMENITWRMMALALKKRKEDEEFKATERPAEVEEAPLHDQTLVRLREAPQVEHKPDNVGEPDQRGRRTDKGKRVRFYPSSNLENSQVCIHPHLGLSSVPAINYDVMDHPSSILDHHHHHRISSRNLTEPATTPVLRKLSIVSEHLPWTISISASNGSYVTVGDVLEGVYNALQKNITPGEYSSLSSHNKRRAAQAYEQRYRRHRSSQAYDLEKRGGMKRVDFLMGRTKFWGLAMTSHGSHMWQLSVT